MSNFCTTIQSNEIICKAKPIVRNEYRQFLPPSANKVIAMRYTRMVTSSTIN